MKKFEIGFVNGRIIVEGKNLKDAIQRNADKIDVDKIQTGYLVRVRELWDKPYSKTSVWGYWDCTEFWKCLHKKKLIKTGKK